MRDPTDETFRKLRRLRNTPLQKYIRITSAVITLMYVGAMYIYYRRKVVPYLNDERYKISEDAIAMQHDYMTSDFLRGVIDKLNKRQQVRLAANTEPEDQIKDTEANKN
ncbi:hypothetical protein EAG_04775 [Camponotus floridanus]|uniref:Uncharacterized protein n=1 Tax=Camponotus floridanus TaxID=104421 RepID=E2AI72_CAMFO|nr:hypothetical protein EAG_04775 [Camponotus floridanus]